jgi:phosphoenolpyruvate phosphomutase
MIEDIKQKRPLAFATMCADPLYHGHINLLKYARNYGNVVLGLMTDEAIKSYKDPPLSTFEERLAVVNEIKIVSFIIPVTSQSHYVSLTNEYQFEFFVHGDDWKEGLQSKSRDKLLKIMPSWGGKVIDAPYTKGISSTQIKNQLD